MKRSPKSPEEWQDAVNVANKCRLIHDAFLYGIITDPRINVERCNELLEEGKRRGFTPRQSTGAL